MVRPDQNRDQSHFDLLPITLPKNILLVPTFEMNQVVTSSTPQGNLVLTISEKWDWRASHVAGLLTTAYIRILHVSIVDIARYNHKIQ